MKRAMTVTKKATWVLAVGLCSTFAVAQRPACNPPSPGQVPTGAAAAPAAEAQGKRPPQAKSKAELDDYNAAIASPDLASFEKAIDSFSAKYPASELRILLYKRAAHLAQNPHNPDKVEAFSRKILEFDPDDPDALVGVATIIIEKSQVGDLDFDSRMAEATKLAQHATETIETDIVTPAGASAAQIEGYKSYVRSAAWGILGVIAFNKGQFSEAETSLRKSINAYPQDVDPVAVLRLGLALDHQGKYADALTETNKVVAMTPAGNPVGDTARSEQSRLQQLVNTKK